MRELQTAPIPGRVNAAEWRTPLLIVLVLFLGYGVAPTRLPLMGEETCRAQHGIEMAESGDWLVATNQGLPILDRPPLQYWTLAVVHKWVHPLDPLTLRLFMAAVLLATSLAIWWYARAFLSETGAFLAAVAYPTMGQVFDLGRRAETDGLFTLLLATALLVWHYGYTRPWRPVWTWALGGILAALATLAKGSQVPVAFFGTVYLFLLVRRDWRYLLSWSHVLGLALFVGLIAVWEVPFYWRTGWQGTRMTWLDPYTVQVNTNYAHLLGHVVTFPAVVLGATLPWSVLLVGLLHRSFWRLEEKTRSAVVFLLLGMATIFVPVWLSQGGRQRYVMPMYPLMAVVCGAVAQQCMAAPLKSLLREFWRGILRVMAVVVAGIVIVFFGATVARAFSDARWIVTFAQPWPWMVGLAVGGTVGVVFLWQQTAPGRDEHGRLVTFALATLLALCFNGPILNATARSTVNLGPQVLALRRSLPADIRLVSFGPIYHRFLYWYGASIPIVSQPKALTEVPEELEYFALDVLPGRPADLPFAWEQIAQLDMSRTYASHPKRMVVVGRRIRCP
jgi:4-amino-4-deoxy-L-arabinose transferase-like glycosyltransferase